MDYAISVKLKKINTDFGSIFWVWYWFCYPIVSSLGFLGDNFLGPENLGPLLLISPWYVTGFELAGQKIHCAIPSTN